MGKQKMGKGGKTEMLRRNQRGNEKRGKMEQKGRAREREKRTTTGEREGITKESPEKTRREEGTEMRPKREGYET